MDGAFLAVLVDNIAPGGRVAKDVTLPSASVVGCDRAIAKALDSNTALQALLDAIVVKAGGASAFSTGPALERKSLLETMQREKPEAFAGLVSLTLAHYYAQPQVLAALGWPTHPPQPIGHKLPDFDDRLVRPVIERGAIWRQC